MPERLDEEELADWRAGRNAVYQLAALTIGARLAVADTYGRLSNNPARCGSGSDRLQGFRSMRSIVSIGTW
jgi:hypothetical protein